LPSKEQVHLLLLLEFLPMIKSNKN